MKKDKNIGVGNQESILDMLSFDSNADKEMPKNIHLKANQKWCPYCSNIVEFVRDRTSGVKRCPICKISENDFWVKKINKKQLK